MKLSWSTLVAVIALLFACASCDSSGTEILGRWKMASDPNGAVWEFSANKAVEMGGRTGKYSFGDQGRLKVQTQFATFVYQLELNGDRMVLTEPNGTRMTFERVK